jgi:hypothetical protein
MTYMQSWKSYRLTSHTWLGLNPQIGRPLSKIFVPLVYFFLHSALGQVLFKLYSDRIFTKKNDRTGFILQPIVKYTNIHLVQIDHFTFPKQGHITFLSKSYKSHSLSGVDNRPISIRNHLF